MSDAFSKPGPGFEWLRRVLQDLSSHPGTRMTLEVLCRRTSPEHHGLKAASAGPTLSHRWKGAYQLNDPWLNVHRRRSGKGTREFEYWWDPDVKRERETTVAPVVTARLKRDAKAKQSTSHIEIVPPEDPPLVPVVPSEPPAYRPPLHDPPPPPPEPLVALGDVLEVIGFTRAGVPLVRDTEGHLYRVMEVFE